MEFLWPLLVLAALASAGLFASKGIPPFSAQWFLRDEIVYQHSLGRQTKSVFPSSGFALILVCLSTVVWTPWFSTAFTTGPIPIQPFKLKSGTLKLQLHETKLKSSLLTKVTSSLVQKKDTKNPLLLQCLDKSQHLHQNRRFFYIWHCFIYLLRTSVPVLLLLGWGCHGRIWVEWERRMGNVLADQYMTEQVSTVQCSPAGGRYAAWTWEGSSASVKHSDLLWTVSSYQVYAKSLKMPFGGIS